MNSKYPDLDKLKDTIQDGNINFLIGSGLSMPFLETLGNIEDILTQLDKKSDVDENKKKLVRAGLYKRYCERVIFKNLQILQNEPTSNTVLANYKNFLTLINSILLNRKNSILSKQINIFTTNVDIYLEKALEEVGFEYNDGFNGRFLPIFSLTNFRKSTFKKSLQYDNVSEIPVFNLLKLHGSLTWAIHEIGEEKTLKFSPDLKHVQQIKETDISSIAEAEAGKSLDDLLKETDGKRVSQTVTNFLDAYQVLPIINPTKDKFKQTLLNQVHYELLRMYANELEKECSILFVMGFSFADEHIREITLRAVDSNPTLTVYIIVHSTDSIPGFEERLGAKNVKNRNIKFIAPDVKEDGTDDFKYDFENMLLKIFRPLSDMVEKGRKLNS